MKTEVNENQSLSNKMTAAKKIILTILCFFYAVSSFANLDNHEVHNNNESVEKTILNQGHKVETHNDENSHNENGKFEPGKMITEHIADAHDWHLWGEGSQAVSIPLPIIIYTKSRGFIFFLSSKFEHGHASHLGFRMNEKGHLVWDDPNASEKILDLSITKNVLAMLIAVLTLSLIVIGMAKSYKNRKGLAPKGIHNLIEPLILFIRDDMAVPLIGKKSDKFLPLLLSIFFFIFVNNLFGLIPIFPGGANVTGNISITLVLALVVFITVNLNGNKYYWKHIFMPDVPVWMYIIIIPIEILGVILKPFVLMLRLFANITAGHIIILGFFSLIFIFGAMDAKIGYMVSPLSVAFTIFMSMLELLVAFLQAFVFTLLTGVYIGMAVEEHHH